MKHLFVLVALLILAGFACKEQSTTHNGLTTSATLTLTIGYHTQQKHISSNGLDNRGWRIVEINVPAVSDLKCYGRGIARVHLHSLKMELILRGLCPHCVCVLNEKTNLVTVVCSCDNCRRYLV